MENTLRVIVDTDKAARMDVEKAKERRENLTKELSERKTEIDKSHKENAENAIAKTRGKAESDVKLASLTLDEKTKKKADELQEKFDEHFDKWVDEIVKSVID